MTESKKLSNHNSTPQSKELNKTSDFKIPEFKTKEELKNFIVGLLKQVKPEVYDELIVDVLDEVDSQRNYYDTIFRTIFSKKEDLLELYNAVNDTNYTNVDDLEINTLNNAMFVTMRNDISFISSKTPSS
jgi:hypothetical protein